MTDLVAALPMYDWPEAREATDREWAALAHGLRAVGIAAPPALVRRNADLPPVPGGITDASGRVIAPDPASLPPDEFDLSVLWRHPSLLLAQTCWGPMEMGLSELVTVVAQPDYSAFDGGEGELYSSVLLMRSPVNAGRPPMEPVDAPLSAQLVEAMRGARLAFNGPDSMSGLIALSRDLRDAGESFALFAEQIETGSHRASITAVAQGRADVCAIDCRTWHLALSHEPRAADLAVVGWTARRKGLPFITARSTPPETVAAMREVLQRPNSLVSSG